MRISERPVESHGEGVKSSGPGRADSCEQSVRRLDWRFLLPDPSLEDVAYLGPEGPLLDALRLVSEPRRLEPGCGLAAHRLVVASQADRSSLELAASRVAPGGFLYLEVERRGNRGRRYPRLSPWGGSLDRSLRSLGLVDLQAHLHWPNFEACKSIIPLERPEPLRFALEQRLPILSGLGLGGWTAGLACRLLPRLWVPCSSVLGRRSSSGAIPSPPTPALESHFLRYLSTPVPARAHSLQISLLTPRFRASHHVVFLAFDAAGRTPLLVAKTPRLEGDEEAIRREAALLQRLQGLRPGGFDSIPRVLAVEDWFRRPLLIETALPGALLSPARIRSRRARYCDLVTSWLVEFHSQTRTRPPTESVDRLIEGPMAKIRKALPDHPLLARSTRALESLPPAKLPGVWEHGDLSHPNLIALESGGVGVLDWESAESQGLPAADLFFFLAFVAREAGQQRLAQRPLRERLGQAFDPLRGWATPHLRRYAQSLELDPAWFPALFTACWVRAIGRLAGQLEREHGQASTGWLAAHPFVQAWEYSLGWKW